MLSVDRIQARLKATGPAPLNIVSFWLDNGRFPYLPAHHDSAHTEILRHFPISYEGTILSSPCVTIVAVSDARWNSDTWLFNHVSNTHHFFPNGDISTILANGIHYASETLMVHAFSE